MIFFNGGNGGDTPAKDKKQDIEIASLQTDDAAKVRKIELLTYQIDEIENKRIRIGQVRVPISETFAKKLNKRLGL